MHTPRPTARRLASGWGPMGLALAVCIGTLVRVPQLFHTFNEAYGFRQAQTAMVIREYARGPLDLLHTPLPVFGAGADVPFEFPLFQAIAALISRLGIEAATAGRIV